MNKETESFDAIVDTPVGAVGIRMAGDALDQLRILGADASAMSLANPKATVVLQGLRDYFNDPSASWRIALTTTGTPFQQRVWRALSEIPAGRVRTYGDLARELGTSARAVGGACRANPRPILVPCHRVVAAHGKGGFAGETAGRWLAIKEMLLRHEGVSWPP